MHPSIHSASLQAAQKKERNEAFKSADNLKLLWRGFYLSIVVGILSQWLRIVPSEALKNDSLIDKVPKEASPINGYISVICEPFNDVLVIAHCNKGSTQGRFRSFVLFQRNDLQGKSYEASVGEHLTYKEIRKRGYESTHALGRMIPSEDTFETMDDGVVVPIGKLTPRNISFAQVYNEFVVYRPEQVKLCYLVESEFAPLNALGS